MYFEIYDADNEELIRRVFVPDVEAGDKELMQIMRCLDFIELAFNSERWDSRIDVSAAPDPAHDWRPYKAQLYRRAREAAENMIAEGQYILRITEGLTADE